MMARINDGTFRDWKNGDTISSDGYEQDREIIRTAINVSDDKIKAHEDILNKTDTGLAPRVSNLESDVSYLDSALDSLSSTVNIVHEQRLDGAEQNISDIQQGNIPAITERLNGADTKNTEQDTRLDVMEGDVYSTLVPVTFAQLQNQNLSFQDYKMGYVDNKISEITTIAPKPNGADDTDSLRTVLNSLTSGGKLLIPEGTYTISGALDVPENVSVSGSGINKTFINWVETDKVIGSNSTMLRFTRNTGYNKSSLSDLTLNQKRNERGLIDNQTYGGVLAANRMVIERVRIHNTVGPGITQAGINDVIVRNCEIYNTGHHCIYFSTGNLGYVHNVKIVDNFLDTPANIIGREFTANNVKMRFEDGGDTIKNIVIENNDIGAARGNTTILSESIFISTTTGTVCSLENVSINNNRINANSLTGTYMGIGVYIGSNSLGKNVNISKNMINSSGIVGSYGIRCLIDNTNTHNVVVRENTIGQTEIGVQVYKGFVAFNNINFTKQGFIGVDGKLFTNVFTSSTDSAIAVYQSTYDIVENTINMTGLTTVGIDFANSTNLLVLRNKITGAVDGIRRPSKVLAGCIIDGNIFVNCTSNYTNIFNSTTTVKNNVIEHSVKDRHGATTDRPNATLIGDRYYDTTLQKPIWWNGTAWKDATGATV